MEFELAPRASAAGVHYSFRNSLVIKRDNFLASVLIHEQGGPTFTGMQPLVGVMNAKARIGSHVWTAAEKSGRFTGCVVDTKIFHLAVFFVCR